jgi:signal transduction histidine kinase
MVKRLKEGLRSRLKNRYFWWSLAVGLGCLVIVYGADRSGFFSTLELKALDLRFLVRGTKPPSGEVIIVTLDDASSKELSEAGPWPWPPNLYVELISRLTQWGAVVVAVDVLVPTPSHYAAPTDRYPKGQDTLLAAAARKSGNVVWAGELDEANSLVPPNDILRPAVAVGFINFPSDEDTFVRRTVPHRGEHISFALKAVELFVGADLSSHFVPDQAYYINYRGPPGTYPAVSLAKVIGYKPDGSTLPGRPEDLFRDKIVLVGVSFHDSSDFHPTPYYRHARTYSTGIEIHANVIDSILAGDFISSPSAKENAAAIFGFGAVSLMLLALVTPLQGLILLPLLLGGYAIFNNYLFAAYQQWAPLAGPLTGAFLLYTGLTCYRQLSEEREKRRIKRTYDNLREVDELKTNFMSLVSHDLKTPVARIKNTLQLMRLDFPDLHGDWSESVGEVIADCDSLTLMISNILSLNRLEAKEVTLDRVTGDLGDLIHQVATSLESEAREKSITLDTNGVQPVYTEFDEGMINQVLNNLIGNAHKYTPAGGYVSVSTDEKDGFVDVFVTDTGYGIPKENLPFIFEKFYRVDKGEAAKIKGTGLGLYLCKYLVELHGGSIHVESAEDKGSTFSFSLPY